MKKDKLLIAVITKVHGINGEVKIRAYTQDYKNFKNYKSFTDIENNQYIISKISTRGSDIILKLENIDDRNAAQLLVGQELYIDKTYLRENDQEEFYHYQLIGTDVYINNEKIGIVKAIHNFGAGEIIEIKKLDQSSEFYSFTKEIVFNINLAENYIEIKPMEEI